MNLEALQHIIRSAQTLAENKSIIVLGSSSLLAHFPELGNPGEALSTTFDADILADPFDELTSIMLNEALGEDRAYYRIHGYHADILRDSIIDTLPCGWRERLTHVPEMESAFALDPHDLAAVKILIGRPKDLGLIEVLKKASFIQQDTVLERIELLPIPVEGMPRVFSTFRTIFGS
ncbi:MAG: DUF6036 family nucleotidyltransferase [Verrucomicrobiota bacterium]